MKSNIVNALLVITCALFMVTALTLSDRERPLKIAATKGKIVALEARLAGCSG